MAETKTTLFVTSSHKFSYGVDYKFFLQFLMSSLRCLHLLTLLTTESEPFFGGEGVGGEGFMTYLT